MGTQKEDRFDILKRTYPYPPNGTSSCSRLEFRSGQSGAQPASTYVEPCLAGPEQIAAAEAHRPVHTCVDDFLAGYCPACNRLEWLKAANAAQTLRKVA